MFNAIKSVKKKLVNESSESANIDASRKSAGGDGGGQDSVRKTDENTSQQSGNDSSLNSVDAAAVGIDHPQEFDILLGRGKTSFNHMGNRRFRAYIGMHLRRYMDAPSRIQKTVVVNSVCKSIQQSGGRFLKQHATTEKWVPVSNKDAREKVGHALRDAAGQRMKMSSASGSYSSTSSPGGLAPIGFMGLPQVPVQHSMLLLPRPTEIQHQQQAMAAAETAAMHFASLQHQQQLEMYRASTAQQMEVIQQQAAFLQQQQQQTVFMLQQRMAAAAARAQPQPPPQHSTHVHSNNVNDGALNADHPVNPPSMAGPLAATPKPDTQDSSGSIGDSTNLLSGEMSVISAMSGLIGGDSVSAGGYSINTNMFDDESEGASLQHQSQVQQASSTHDETTKTAAVGTEVPQQASPTVSSAPSGNKVVVTFAGVQQPDQTKSSDAGTTADGSGGVSINDTELSEELSGMSLSTNDVSSKRTTLSDMVLTNAEINLHEDLPVEERHPLHDEHDDHHSTMQASIGSDICDSQGNVIIPKGASSVKSGGTIHKEWNGTLLALSGREC